MNFDNYIEKSILENAETALPGIGIFTVKYQHARYCSETKQLLPPSGQILFFPNDRQFEKSLVKFVEEKSTLILDDFDIYLNELLEKYNQGEKIEIENVGSLQKKSAKVVFIPDSKNLLVESFGFNEVGCNSPIRFPEIQEKKMKPEGMSAGFKTKMRVLATCVFIMLWFFPARTSEIRNFPFRQTETVDNVQVKKDIAIQEKFTAYKKIEFDSLYQNADRQMHVFDSISNLKN